MQFGTGFGSKVKGHVLHCLIDVTFRLTAPPPSQNPPPPKHSSASAFRSNSIRDGGWTSQPSPVSSQTETRGDDATVATRRQKPDNKGDFCHRQQQLRVRGSEQVKLRQEVLTRTEDGDPGTGSTPAGHGLEKLEEQEVVHG